MTQTEIPDPDVMAEHLHCNKCANGCDAVRRYDRVWYEKNKLTLTIRQVCLQFPSMNGSTNWKRV